MTATEDTAPVPPRHPASAVERAAANAAHPDTFGIAPEVYHRRWIILGVLNISLVMVVTAVSSLNVAIPSIRDALDASGTQLQWIIDAYALVFAGMLLTAGALGDRFGRKGALLVGLTVFGLGSLAASQAASPAVLIGIRAALGVGAALIMPSTLSIIVNAFPPFERPKAIAIWAGFAGVGGALGPISSGLLIDHFWWGSVFFVNVILAALLIGLVGFLVPTSKDPNATALDFVGAGLSLVGLASLVFGVIQGPELGWTHPLTLVGFVVAVAALVGFVRYELRITHPMLDPRLFKLHGFSAGAGAVTLAFFAMFGQFFLLTQYLQYVKGFTPLETGVRVIPSALMLVLVAPRSPKLVARFGVKKVVRAGFLCTTTGLFLFGLARADTPYLLIAIGLVINGAGMAMLMPPSSQHIVGSLPLHKAGVGSAVNDVTREVGGALGIALAGSVTATIYRAHADFVDRIGDAQAREAALGSIGQALGVGKRALASGAITPPQFEQLRTSAASAFVSGTSISFWVLSGVLLFAAVVIPRFIPDALPTPAAMRPGGEGHGH